MEQKDNNLATDKVLAFDTVFTTNHIKILKVLFFFLDSPMQKMLAMYIKFQEIRYIITYFNRHSSTGTGTLDFTLLFQEILPYCDREEKNKFEQFAQMKQMMEQFRQISQTMEMMKELFPEGMPGFDFSSEQEPFSGSCSDNPSMPFNEDLLSYMIGGEENIQLFEMLTAMMNPNNKL